MQKPFPTLTNLVLKKRNNTSPSPQSPAMHSWVRSAQHLRFLRLNRISFPKTALVRHTAHLLYLQPWNVPRSGYIFARGDGHLHHLRVDQPRRNFDLRSTNRFYLPRRTRESGPSSSHLSLPNLKPTGSSPRPHPFSVLRDEYDE